MVVDEKLYSADAEDFLGFPIHLGERNSLLTKIVPQTLFKILLEFPHLII
jgi:hypothetical protein